MHPYFTITNAVVLALYAISFLLVAHFAVFGVVGLFKRKVFPTAEKKLRYGIVIGARNEQAVIGNLIESIKASDYPQDKIQIFVVAHNCTDDTAAVARAAGATVYEYNNPDECTKGYAARYLFKQIERDFGTQNYAAFITLDADNVLDTKFMEKMNDAFVANGERVVVTSFRNSKNFGTNVISAMYGLYFVQGCRIESRGRTVLGCSTRVQGTGYLIPASVVKDGWNYVTLTEDWELTADQVLAGTPILYCDEAVTYDEQPTDIHIMWRQRLRWAKGHLLVGIGRFKDVLRTLFTRRSEDSQVRKFSVFDLGMNIYPSLIVFVVILLIQQIFIWLSPLFGRSVLDSYVATMPSTLIGFALYYIFTMLVTTMVYFVERKRIHKFNPLVKLGSILLMPLFLAVSFVLAVVALFTKDISWKPIPHKDTTDLSTLQAMDEELLGEEAAASDEPSGEPTDFGPEGDVPAAPAE